jgi:DNA-binding NtrC family response regulator
LTYREAVLAFQREYWEKLLAQYGGSVPQAARKAGVCRTGAYNLIRRLDIPVRRWGRYGNKGRWNG